MGMESQGLMKMLPRHKAEPDVDKPAYVTDVVFSMNTSQMLASLLPKKVTDKGHSFMPYKYMMYHKTHSVDRTLEVAKFEWDRYQETWKARGIEHDYVPYPYSKQDVQGWCDTYNKEWAPKMGAAWVNIDPDGNSAKDWSKVWGWECSAEKFQIT